MNAIRTGPPPLELQPWPRTWLSHAQDAALGRMHVVHAVLCNRGEAPLSRIEVAQAPTLGSCEGYVSFPGADYPLVVSRILQPGACTTLRASFPDCGEPAWSPASLALVVRCAGWSEVAAVTIDVPLP